LELLQQIIFIGLLSLVNQQTKAAKKALRTVYHCQCKHEAKVAKFFVSNIISGEKLTSQYFASSFLLLVAFLLRHSKIHRYYLHVNQCVSCIKYQQLINYSIHSHLPLVTGRYLLLNSVVVYYLNSKNFKTFLSAIRVYIIS